MFPSWPLRWPQCFCVVLGNPNNCPVTIINTCMGYIFIFNISYVVLKVFWRFSFSLLVVVLTVTRFRICTVIVFIMDYVLFCLIKLWLICMVCGQISLLFTLCHIGPVLSTKISVFIALDFWIKSSLCLLFNVVPFTELHQSMFWHLFCVWVVRSGMLGCSDCVQQIYLSHLWGLVSYDHVCRYNILIQTPTFLTDLVFFLLTWNMVYFWSCHCICFKHERHVVQHRATILLVIPSLIRDIFLFQKGFSTISRLYHFDEESVEMKFHVLYPFPSTVIRKHHSCIQCHCLILYTWPYYMVHCLQGILFALLFLRKFLSFCISFLIFSICEFVLTAVYLDVTSDLHTLDYIW